MRGRIPNWIKEAAKSEIEKYGALMAHHYACYNTNWGNPSIDDLRLISAIEKLGGLKCLTKNL